MSTTTHSIEFNSSFLDRLNQAFSPHQRAEMLFGIEQELQCAYITMMDVSQTEKEDICFYLNELEQE